jgi:predicted 3-demethylubiquinone-9 3-methyltransferase (glyoxalase superfamily)
MQKITPCLWFDRNAEEAMNFYCSIFPDSQIYKIHRYPSEGLEGPMKGFENQVLTGVFQLAGMMFHALDGGPIFKFTPANNFMVSCETAEETREIFNKLNEGREPLMPLQKYPFSEMYGWTADKYGLSWQVGMMPGPAKQKITPGFMFVQKNFGKVEEALNFYTTLFKNSSIDMVAKYEEGEGDEVGKVKYSAFTLEGMQFSAMESSGPHHFDPNEAISFQVDCADQAEIDYFWNAMTADGGMESQCGWLKDKYGFSWQIVPEMLGGMLNDPDQDKVQRVTHAFLQMKKLDIAALEAAANQNY